MGVGNGERGLVCGQEHAHPDAGEGDVALHVHAVGAVVRAGDVAQAGMIESGDVGPESGFDLRAKLADTRGGS